MSNSLAILKKAKVLSILEELETKGNATNSVIEGVKTTAVSLAGASIGKLAGRPSLLVGLGTTMAGHYFKNNRLTYFGVGIMAGGGIALAEGFGATDKPVGEKIKERLKHFGSDVKHRLYLDKFIKPKPKSEGTGGLGEVQYFKYPSNELDMGALNSIEEEITRNTAHMERQQMTGYGGGNEDVSGMDDPIY